MPSSEKICCCTSGRWIRTLPEPSSQPLSTRSYASDRTREEVLARAVREELEVVGVRHRERVVRRDRAAVVVEALEQREVDDPEELQAALVHGRAAELDAQRAEHVVDDAGRAPATTSNRSPGSRPERVDDAELLGLGQELRAPASRARRRRRPASTPARRRRAAWPGRPACRPGPATSPPSPGSRMPFTTSAWKARNSVAANTSLEVDQLEAEPHVGLVGRRSAPSPGATSCAGHRRRLAPVTASAASSTASPIDGHHVVGVGEAHLGVELHELELPVGAQVFVAQAAGDLVVAVEAARPSAAA